MKAALLLLPLLGITHMFELYHDEPKNWIVNLLLSIINAFLVFYQGVFLSFLYCFCNNEVSASAGGKWRRMSAAAAAVITTATTTLTFRRHCASASLNVMFISDGMR